MMGIGAKTLIIICVLLVSCPVYAVENLDELEARQARKSTNTFYSGETAGNNYLWQPQTVQYTDTTYSTEVWLYTQTDDTDSWSGHEWGHNPWSADGKKLAIALDKATAAFSLTGSYSADEIWFTCLADGSQLRPRTGSKARSRIYNVYTQWSPVVPDRYYVFGSNYTSEGANSGHLYQETVSDTNIITSQDVLTVDTSLRLMNKSAISGDGKYAFVSSDYNDGEPWSIVDLTDYTIYKDDFSWPAISTNWGDSPTTFTDLHDGMFSGNAAIGYWYYFMPAGTHIWWRMRVWGTDGNEPNYTHDTTSPYDWWEGTTAQMEVQPLNTHDSYGTKPFDLDYWSHFDPDRWGTHAAYNDVEGTYTAPGAVDIESMAKTAVPTASVSSNYGVYKAWSDRVVYSGGGTIIDMYYDDFSTLTQKATTNNVQAESDWIRTGQSPDGTKSISRVDFLQSTGVADLQITTMYYPYPPEIISVSSGTVRFDWRTDQTTSRGYTQRGWPDEDTDDPPPPRETSKFRLWKSANGTTGWAPVGTVDAEIFTRYDFAGGTWDGSNYWEITDPDPSGYYAVTSVEWSGLESRTVSNVFSAAGSQTATYPATPGEGSGVSSTYDADLIRYYNIYADDGATPTITQTMRIASIPASAQLGTYVDWLGDTGGDTEYVVTAVDTQGNESTALSGISTTHKLSPATADGQYTITLPVVAIQPTGMFIGGTYR